MSLLSRHLEQISLSSESIATLPFPPPKIFTNALLSTPDITSLIRDTEPHERALFSVPPAPPPSTSTTPYPDPKASSRRQTVFNVAGGEVTAGTSGPGNRAPRRNTAVAAVLGPELHSEVRKTEGKGNGELDIEVLLRGAETLNGVYAVAGVGERIARVRERYAVIVGSLGFYEGKVERMTRELEGMNRSRGGEWGGDYGDQDGEEGEEQVEITEEDLRREEEEIRELERKKRELEERVKEMEKDLGGLLR
ncbi:DASH complex, subunit Spc34 [Mollisia scopiformis]|uniref:DASH complex subunit SPC34 n=1 Tax=Mollisia scopiformis TaxID=149040 RepID=A0A194X3X2_MOLSC|nr:DASH complex, subunit Spc34 [Mollisia scopiformis]KUJ14885.1 DASH complex, subunit Spc34 [Mollisia scopiformis]